MKLQLADLPLILVLLAALALLAYGPVEQLAHYHAFADRRPLLGIRNATDVLYNVPFAMVAGWGWLVAREDGRFIGPAWSGYKLFLFSLMLTAFGSGFYHWAPDNPRLVWDRLPIALACAGLLAAAHAEVRPAQAERFPAAVVLGVLATASVAWWVVSGEHGYGDLRPYLLLQVLPLVLIPLWQWIYHSPAAARRKFALAIALYVFAKIAELLDHQIFSFTGFISGHTVKHLLSAAAAAAIVSHLRCSVRAVGLCYREAPPPVRIG